MNLKKNKKKYASIVSSKGLPINFNPNNNKKLDAHTLFRAHHVQVVMVIKGNDDI